MHCLLCNGSEFYLNEQQHMDIVFQHKFVPQQIVTFVKEQIICPLTMFLRPVHSVQLLTVAHLSLFSPRGSGELGAVGIPWGLDCQKISTHWNLTADLGTLWARF